MIRCFLIYLVLGALLLALGACTTSSQEGNNLADNNPALDNDDDSLAADAPVCQPTQPLNLRPGPGTSFNPPLREISPDEALTPLAFHAQGFPGGQWLEVAVVATGELGWVSAGSAFIACNINPASLPPAANIPPTPTNVPTNTSQAVAQIGPPRISNNPPGGAKAEYVLDEVIVDDAFLFRMWIADTRFGEQDGDGIDHVDFTISSQEQSQVIYENREDNAAFCVFQGGLPDCNGWRVKNGRFVWPNGIEVEPGGYHATILVFPQEPAYEGEVWNWDFDFWIDTP